MSLDKVISLGRKALFLKTGNSEIIFDEIERLDEKIDELPEIAKGEKGDKGERGEKGAQGETGPRGISGLNGIDGRDGSDGRNGRDGLNGIDGKNGNDGLNGIDGKDGQDAVIVLDELADAVIETIKKEKRLELKDIKGAKLAEPAKRLDMGDLRWHGGGISSLKAGANIVLVADGNGGYTISTTSGLNVTIEQATASQSGANVAIDLATLTHTVVAVLLVTRQGQAITPGVPTDGSSGWTKLGNIITVYNADASESFLVQYAY